METLSEHFDLDASDFSEEEYGPAVFGASLIGFPKTLKTRRTNPRGLRSLESFSSQSLRNR
jgi:hypothetical protein